MRPCEKGRAIVLFGKNAVYFLSVSAHVCVSHMKTFSKNFIILTCVDRRAIVILDEDRYADHRLWFEGR